MNKLPVGKNHQVLHLLALTILLNISIWATAHLPLPNPTLTLNCCQLTVVELGEGWVGSCPDTDIDPGSL